VPLLVPVPVLEPVDVPVLVFAAGFPDEVEPGSVPVLVLLVPVFVPEVPFIPVLLDAALPLLLPFALLEELFAPDPPQQIANTDVNRTSAIRWMRFIVIQLL